MGQNVRRSKKKTQKITSFILGRYVITGEKDQTSASAQISKNKKYDEIPKKKEAETKKGEEDDDDNEEEKEEKDENIDSTPIIAPPPIKGFEMEDEHYTDDDHIKHLLFTERMIMMIL